MLYDNLQGEMMITFPEILLQKFQKEIPYVGSLQKYSQEEHVKHTITAGQHQIHNFISRDVCFFFSGNAFGFFSSPKSTYD